MRDADSAPALPIDAREAEDRAYPRLLRRLIERARCPLAAALDAGVFDDDGRLAEFHSGLDQLLDGIAAKVH